LGKSEVLREGKDIAIIALGSMVLPSLSAAEILAKEGIDAWVVNSRFVKPLDAELFKDIGAKVKFIFTVEEGILAGGFGSAVLEIIDKPVIRMGLPCEFIPHGARDILLSQYGLTAQGIVDKIKSVLW
jgi:1-deoxy-D-xylulose-5-phosphate synthase